MLVNLLVLATEGGIPPSNPWAKIAFPLGALIFLGSVYMLVRANLGTRRGYLVTATSLFAFMVIYSLFWAFGAPGTPPTTGPQNLPGQAADAYLPVWVPFAPDSRIAEDPTYDVVQQYPQGFGEVPADFEDEAEEGADEIKTLFTARETRVLSLTQAPADIRYAEAENGRPIIGVIFKETYQAPGADDEPLPEGVEVGDIIPESEEEVMFAYFDAGSPLFPSLVVIALSILGFLIHAVLLDLDERRERRALAGETPAETREPVTTG